MPDLVSQMILIQCTAVRSCAFSRPRSTRDTELLIACDDLGRRCSAGPTRSATIPDWVKAVCNENLDAVSVAVFRLECFCLGLPA